MSWTSDKVRETFLDFYANRGHRRASSLSLVPPGDPTLLFTNAGMVQFKDVFTGRSSLNYKTATTSQKCLRVSGKHNDLENVGRTARHHTFFEMLGNFSFGDYFKADAIESAWELLTEVYKLDVSKLFVTVYPSDTEARDLWGKIAGLAEDKIVDDPENFWSMGDTGPCGPCSEIHIDQGETVQGDDRLLEIWNLVFMQYDRDAAGKLTPLPAPSIDTGMGLERLAAVLQGEISNYHCDLFTPIIQHAADLAGVTYGRGGSEQDVALRVIADHSRSAAFLIADGIYPSNEGRGYVIRRVMRRAMRFGRKLGLEKPFLVETCATVVERMKAAFPELEKKRDIIHKYVLREDEGFGRTLIAGLKRLEKGFEEFADAQKIPGAVAFELYDTHGFPLDMTEQAAAERGFAVDVPGFEIAMERQRAAGRQSWRAAVDTSRWEQLRDKVGGSTFTGYDSDEAAGTILAVLDDGAILVTDITPFYAESGGQVGDTGVIASANGTFRVADTQSPIDGVIVHHGETVEGGFEEGQRVNLRVDSAERDLTRRNHSATHLMHYALREVLGDHVKQGGSMVAPHRLRFDFTHFGPLTHDEIVRVEELVNARIIQNASVSTELMNKDAALEAGAIAFFGDKYGELVRVLTITDDSVELCGGTHVRATGDIGLFKIVAEASVSSGVRRVEAVTGMDAVKWVHDCESTLRSVAESLEVGVPEVHNRLTKLRKDHARLEKKVQGLEDKARVAGVAEARPEQIGDVQLITLALENVKGGAMRDVADKARAKLGSGVVLVVSQTGSKVALLVAVTEDLQGRLQAGKLLGAIAPLVGGRGGGRPDLAQGGGSDPAGIPAAIASLKELIA